MNLPRWWWTSRSNWRSWSPGVTTYPSTGGRGETQRCIFQKGKHARVATNAYLRKTLEKPKRGLRILRIKVRELFMYGEGISTPRVRHKERQPLIECAKSWLQYLFYFPFFMFFTFWGRQECDPCSYVSSSAMRNSNLHSSLVWKFVCLIIFMFLKDWF